MTITDPNKTYVPGIGPSSPNIVIVGESPGYEEISALKPFVGASGKLLNELLREAGINRNDCWVTNVCKYFVEPSPKKRPIPFQVRARNAGIDLNACINELRTEICSLQPNIIIALGGTALYALTGKNGIQDYRGSILSAFGYKCIASYHPAHILYSTGESTGQWNKLVLLHDLKRAEKQSHFREHHLPQRNLSVVRNSAELYSFLKMYDGYTKPSVDIEAYRCIPICIGISYVKHHGITIPLWNMEGISNISSNDLANCWQLLSERLYFSDVVGQNFGYDRDKIKRLGFRVRSIASDTMLKSFCISPELPKNLAFNTSIYTEEPFYKNEGMYEGSFEDLLIGCARDACVTKEVDDAMDADLDYVGGRDYYEKFLLPIQNVYAGIEAVGFKVDEDIRVSLLKKYIEWDERLRHRLYQLTGKYINCNSPLQVSKLLYDDLKIPGREGTGEDILTSIINKSKDETIIAICDNILENRKVRKTTSTYLYCPTDFDGRMRTSYFICLNTGRSSTNQQDPPIRPDVEYIDTTDGKKVKKRQSRGMAFQTLTKHGDIGPDIRTMLVPDEGHVLVQADGSQAEARVVFLLAEDYEALELIDKIDYHALTTTWFFGGEINDYDKSIIGYEKPERFVGKAQPLHSKILTPNGWKLMKDIQVGDILCDSMYETCTVTGVFPQGIKEVYKITTSDNGEAECCKEHIWNVQTISDRNKGVDRNINIEEMKSIGLFNGRGNPKIAIPRQNAMRFNYQFVPIDPYVLGCLIGDGSFTADYNCQLFTIDREILDEFIKRLGKDKIGNPSPNTYNISSIRPLLNDLGLGGKKSEAKFIPEIYKINLLEFRLEILQGLMDTDGTINEFGSAIEYSTSSKQLAEDIIFLVRSLGGIANMTSRIPTYEYKGEEKEGKLSYRVFINIRQLCPFKLPRKAERWKLWDKKTKYNLQRNIISIEKVGEYECQCISVDSKDHLYVTDSFLLTHNTLRHLGHLGGKARRAAAEVNTAARKFKIPITISERKAEDALRTFHSRQPKIVNIFHNGVINALQKDRTLRAPVPYGIDAKLAPPRTFYGRWDDDLFREAFGLIPQRTVSEMVKSAALRIVGSEEHQITGRAPWIKIVVESHDALTTMVPIDREKEATDILREEMQRPIDFSTCSIQRGKLIIPCEIERGFNYKDLKKVKII